MKSRHVRQMLALILIATSGLVVLIGIFQAWLNPLIALALLDGSWLCQ